jgi:hypothetical protein
MIVLSPNPAYKLREQLLRLWRRSRGHAAWIGLNAVAFFAASFCLPAGLFIAGGFLAAQEDQPVYLLTGGLLTALALPIGRKTWRWGHEVLLTVAAAMVEQRQPHPDEKPPLLTRTEGRAIREALAALQDVRAKVDLAAANRDPHPLRMAAERWQNATTSVPSRVSLRRIEERIDVVRRVLYGGANATDGEEVRLHAEVAEVVLGEVEQALRRALRREGMGQGAYMWADTYENLTREDREQHGGRPVALKQWLDQYRRENLPNARA